MSDMTFQCILFDKSAINLVDFERSIEGGQSMFDFKNANKILPMSKTSRRELRGSDPAEVP